MSQHDRSDWLDECRLALVQLHDVGDAAEILDSSRTAEVTAMGIAGPKGEILVVTYLSRPTQRVDGRLFCRDRSGDRSCEDPLCRVDDHGSPNR